MAPIRLEDLQPENTEAIFRSAPMIMVQFYMTLELARDVVNELGKLGDVHFRDLNLKLTPFQRTFVSDLRKIDGFESELEYLYATMDKYGTITGDLFKDFDFQRTQLLTPTKLDELKAQITQVHSRIQHLDESYARLEQQKMKLIENRYLLNAVSEFHGASANALNRHSMDFEIHDEEEDEAHLLNDRNEGLESGIFGTTEVDLAASSSFNSINGTISSEKIPLLRKILWRALRGNLYFHDIPITEEKLSNFNLKNEEKVNKSIFMVFAHGEFLRERVKKIINSLDGTIYDNYNGSSTARSVTLSEINTKIEDMDNVVENTQKQLISELMLFKEIYPESFFAIKKEKAIYQTLNKFDMDGTRRCLIGEGWIPRVELPKIQRTLKKLVRLKSRTHGNETPDLDEDIAGTTNDTLFSLGNDDTFDGLDDANEDDNSFVAIVNELATNRTPPTYHKVNKFTGAFQLIIDAYGIATYQEVNPGLATIVTFPFMFAIMFGDLGHGFIVFLISLYFIINEVSIGQMRNRDEIFDMAYSGRYIILLMGVFSMYTGFIYNDVFSKSMTLFKSGWEWKFPEGYDFEKDGPITLTAQKIAGKTYWFGLDWAWHGTENALLFTNSYKMKLSIVMGYIHMNYSLFFSLVNYVFFNSKVDIIGNFIPGFLFMQSIFGYLVLTIIYKWCVDWIGQDRAPPGLLNMLINMFLAPGSIDVPLYPGQKFVQIVLVLIALVCVPWLLVYKPLVLKKQNERAQSLGYSDLNSQIHHSLQQHEEDNAINQLEHELNGEANMDEVDMLNDTFTFPNDIEPMNVNSAHGDHDGFNLGDVVIHQVIHTIEFCLNCVSHTASYLRLWALSLAHAQLSTVLWSMTIQNAFGATGTSGVITTVLLFGLWFVLSVCILVLMEGTSAMLHSLRLHWVEAMSKFFVGEGYAYDPFTFDSIEY